MNTARAIIEQLGACYGVAKTLTDLVQSTGKPRPKVCDYLDQLILDGVVTRTMRPVFPWRQDSERIELFELADYTPALVEYGFPA